MNIFKFELKKMFKSCLIWSAVCGMLIVLFMGLFPSMADMGMQEIVNNKMSGMSVDMLKAFNIDTGLISLIYLII